MAITKDKKTVIVSKLKTIGDSAKSVVFVNFTKVPVTLATELRKKLGQEGVSYVVTKKTLLKRAFSEQGFTGDMPELPGEVAVAYGADPLTPSKSIYAYQKSNPDQFKIVGGIYEGGYVDSVYMTAIAKIPGREVLLGQLAYLFNWPAQSMAIALSEIAKKKGAGEPALSAEVSSSTPEGAEVTTTESVSTEAESVVEAPEAVVAESSSEGEVSTEAVS